MPREDGTRGDRRDISMKGLTHQRVTVWCADRGLRVGPTIEAWIHERLDREQQPLVKRPENGR